MVHAKLIDGQKKDGFRPGITNDNVVKAMKPGGYHGTVQTIY